MGNPDGYEFTWNSNRMWRKNRRAVGARAKAGEDNGLGVEEAQARQQQEADTKQFFGFPTYPQAGAGYPGGSGGNNGLFGGFPGFPGAGGGAPAQPQRPSYPSKCSGVDPNRNFDVSFAVTGSSNKPCSDTYHGPRAFSEAESRAVKDAVLGIGPRLVSFVSVHAYSQLWMFPYGHVKRVAKDHNDLKRLAQVAVSALTSTYGTAYKEGPISRVIMIIRMQFS